MDIFVWPSWCLHCQRTLWVLKPMRRKEKKLNLLITAETTPSCSPHNLILTKIKSGSNRKTAHAFYLFLQATKEKEAGISHSQFTRPPCQGCVETTFSPSVCVCVLGLFFPVCVETTSVRTWEWERPVLFSFLSFLLILTTFPFSGTSLEPGSFSPLFHALHSVPITTPLFFPLWNLRERESLSPFLAWEVSYPALPCCFLSLESPPVSSATMLQSSNRERGVVQYFFFFY